MDKESYSVDEILSEVKKRRESSDAQLRQNNTPTPSKSSNEAKTENLKENKPQNKTAYAPKAQKPKEQSKNEATADIPKITENKNGKTANVENKKQANKGKKNKKQQKNVQPSKQPKAEKTVISEPQPQEKNTDDKQIQAQSSEEMVNLFALSEQSVAEYPEEVMPENKKNKKKNKVGTPFRKTKKGKIIIAVIAILVALIIAGGTFAAVYVNNMLNKTTEEEEDYKKTTYTDMDFLKEDFPAIKEMDAGQFSSYRDYLKWWYETGDPVSSTHVKNILLIGEDTRESEISDTSRADSAIIASVNIDTGKITLTSVLRDLYVYFEVNGKDGQYGKINAPAALGGMKEYINTVERYYKISIDNYAVVNFASFPKIIDNLGGVSIKITSSEIYEINNHPNVYGGVVIEKNFDGTEGTMKLTGEQALAYCRIRHIDSDGMRANRQKTVLLQMFTQLKDASNTELLKVVTELSSYVKTGYSKKELLSMATYALNQGWMGYETQTVTVPSEENSKGGDFKNSNGGYTYGGWIWKSDIPKDAYDLQMKIYGKSNITLSQNRCKYIDLY